MKWQRLVLLQYNVNNLFLLDCELNVRSLKGKGLEERKLQLITDQILWVVIIDKIFSCYCCHLWICTEDPLDEEAMNDCSSEHSSFTKTESDPPGDLSLPGEHVSLPHKSPLCMVSLLFTKVLLSWSGLRLSPSPVSTLVQINACVSNKRSVSGSW